MDLRLHNNEMNPWVWVGAKQLSDAFKSSRWFLLWMDTSQLPFWNKDYRRESRKKKENEENRASLLSYVWAVDVGIRCSLLYFKYGESE